MKVHHSTQNYFSTPIRSKQDSSADDSTPFGLPGGSGNGGTQQDGSQGPSIASSGVPSSISSGLWLNQVAAAASDGSTGGDDSTTASASASTASSKKSNQDILDEFSKWANMTPAQKIRAQYLESHGLTEESFRALSADDQKAINDQIAEQIKQKLGVGNIDANGKDKQTDSATSALSLA